MKTKFVFGLATFAFWLLMMVALGWREGLFHAPPQPREKGEDAPSSLLLGAYGAEGEEIGRIRSRRFRQIRDGVEGWTTAFDAEMRVRVLEEESVLRLRGDAWRPAGGTGARFAFAVESGPHEFGVEGRVEAGELRATLASAGERIPLSFPIDDSLFVSSAFGGALELPELAVGETAVVDSFDPVTLQKGKMRLRCLRQESLTIAGRRIETRLVEISSGAFRSRAWVDSAGALVRAETPLGIRLQRIEPGEAADPAAEAASSLLDLAAVRWRGKRPRRGARELRIRTIGEPLAPLPEIPSEPRQEREGAGRLRITASSPPAAEGPEPGADLLRYLEAEPLVQSDHPEIRRRAGEIVGGETDPWRRALRIHDWVYARLEKEAVLSVPSALEVLASRRGDCNEHTVLFAALARASGLPTRIAIGLVWSDEAEGFYYHAWPEVYVGEWIRMDPTLGQPLADATHIKLLEGGIERWPRLLPFLGRLEIEVLTTAFRDSPAP